MRCIVIMVALVLGSACGAREPKPEPKTEAAPTPQPVFQGDEVTLPPQFAGLEFGMTLAEARVVLPDISDSGRVPHESASGHVLTAEFSRGDTPEIEQFSVLADVDVIPQLTELWGPPRMRNDGSRELWRWFNDETELCAELSKALADQSGSKVEFMPCQPIAKFLGEGPELAFQAHAPLLGMTPTQVDAAYGDGLTDFFRDQVRKHGDELMPAVVRFPAVGWDDHRTGVQLSASTGTVDGLSFYLVYGSDPAARAEIMALLIEKWGEATEVDMDPAELHPPATRWVFSQAPNIRVDDEPKDQRLLIQVSLPTTAAAAP